MACAAFLRRDQNHLRPRDHLPGRVLRIKLGAERAGRIMFLIEPWDTSFRFLVSSTHASVDKLVLK